MQEERYSSISSSATGGINKPVYPAELARIVLSQCEISPKKFKGIYSDADIQGDIDWAINTEKKFEPSPIKKYGDIFEAIVYERGAKSGWFGTNSQIIKTSRFDDYRNKIDLVVETQDEAGEFTQSALGVDVTFGSQDLAKNISSPTAPSDKNLLAPSTTFPTLSSAQRWIASPSLAACGWIRRKRMR